MANEEHLKILKQGVKVWNKWREENPEIQPDLTRANLRKAYLPKSILSEVDLTKANLSMADLGWAYLIKANLSETDLSGACLIEAYLTEANLYDANLAEVNLSMADLTKVNLTKANLSMANLSGAYLSEADLSRADLSEADLSWTDLRKTNLNGAKLIKANLRFAQLVETNLEKTNLTGCSIYGISAWDLNLKDAKQSDLIITPPGEPTITVDNLEVAQFIYLLLYNEKIRHVIDTITSKVVLILGRFTPEQMKVLDAIKEELRQRDYLPVLFKFEKPINRSFRETVLTVAHLARFVIADFTRAKIVLDEVPHIVEKVAVPVQPLLKGSGREPVTLPDLRVNHRSLLETYRYKNLEDLLASFKEKVIIPAEAKVKELNEARAKELLKSKKRRL